MAVNFDDYRMALSLAKQLREKLIGFDEFLDGYPEETDELLSEHLDLVTHEPGAFFFGLLGPTKKEIEEYKKRISLVESNILNKLLIPTFPKL